MMDHNYRRLVTSEVEFNDLFEEDESDEAVLMDKNEIDYTEFSTYVQGFYFDLYGTNVPTEKMQDIFNALPRDIKNESSAFNEQLMKALTSLKAYDWLEISNNNTYTSQEMVQDAMEVSNSDDVTDSYNELDGQDSEGPSDFDDVESDMEVDEPEDSDDSESSGVKSVLPASSNSGLRRTAQREDEIVSSLAEQLIKNNGWVAFEV